MKYKRDTKPIEEELEVPDYPKRLEKKIAQQQRIKGLFSFYSNLSKEKKINIILVFAAVVVFAGLLSSKPAMTGFHSFIGNIVICDSCINDEAKANTVIKFIINSNNSDGNLKIIYPVSWSVVDSSGGYVSVYDKENYQIEWRSVNGKVVYALMSPDKAGVYSFKAVFNGFVVDNKLIRIK